MTYTCTITTKRPWANKDGTCSTWCPLWYVAGGAKRCRWQDGGCLKRRPRPGKGCPWKSYLTRARIWWDNSGHENYQYYRENNGTVTTYMRQTSTGMTRNVGNYPAINEAIVAAWIDYESGRG